MAIEKAKQYKKGKVNLTWGTFITNSINPVGKKSKK